MSTPYTYFRITPGSPAAAVMAGYDAACKVMHDAAAAYAAKHIPVAAIGVVMNHSRICGFSAGEGVTHRDLLTACMRAHGDRAWTINSKNRWFIYPAKNKARHRDCPERLTEFLALPIAPAWDTIVARLVGAGHFGYGLSITSGSLHTAPDDSRVLGVPWLATQGNMGNWAPKDAKFAPLPGLVKMPYDEAFAIITAPDKE